MNSESFYTRIKKKIAEHPFNPICVEVTARKENSRKYEKTFKRKNAHHKWRKTEAGHESELQRGKRYREKNKDNEEYILRRRRNSRNCFRRKRERALFLVLTNIDQEALIVN